MPPKKKTRPVIAWMQYLPLRFFVAVMRLLGVRCSLWLAGLASRGFYRLDRKHRERAHRHLRVAFPDWQDDEVERVARASCEGFCKLAVEMVFLPIRVHKGNFESHLQRTDEGDVRSMLRARQPMLLVAGHFGNWESIGYFISQEGFAMNAVARPLDNALINDWLYGLRSSRGMKVIEKWDQADRRIVEALENNEAVGFVADQNGGDRGVYVPFFGKLASTHKTIGLLAVNMELPVGIGYGFRTEPHALQYEIGSVDVIRPEDWADQPDPQYYIAARMVRGLEQLIREHPEQYLWMHRRWKSRPKFEREGKPMPASLERKLRSLPWVDDAMMKSLKEPMGWDTYKL